MYPVTHTVEQVNTYSRVLVFHHSVTMTTTLVLKLKKEFKAQFEGINIFAVGSDAKEAQTLLAAKVWRKTQILVSTPTPRLSEEDADLKGTLLSMVDILRSGMVSPITQRSLIGTILKHNGRYFLSELDEEDISPKNSHLIPDHLMEQVRELGWTQELSEETCATIHCAAEETVILELLSIKWTRPQTDEEQAAWSKQNDLDNAAHYKLLTQATQAVKDINPEAKYVGGSVSENHINFPGHRVTIKVVRKPKQ